KKGSLDKIESDNENFLDLKTIVNADGTAEVMTSSNDSQGNEFEYETLEQARQLRYESNIDNGMSEEEARADANKLEFNKDNARTCVCGETLSPNENPAKNGNWRVIVPDATGKTSEMPRSELASTTAHELYVHTYLGMQGKPFRHEYGGPDKPLGPVDARTKQ